MTKIELSSSTNSDGVLMFNVLVCGEARIAATRDGVFAAQYARQIYHSARGAAVIVRYDGDTGISTVLESKKQ